MTSTTEHPPGIYHIVVAGGHFASQRLTDGENYVTVSPPSVDDDPRQEWRIEQGEDGTILITRVSPIFLIPYLTYKDAPEKPKAGDRIEVRNALSPLNRWRPKHTHIFTINIQVDGSDLGIGIAPPRIDPPFLELSQEGLDWRFEFVREIEK